MFIAAIIKHLYNLHGYDIVKINTVKLLHKSQDQISIKNNKIKK